MKKTDLFVAGMMHGGQMFFLATANAMAIPQFDKMSAQDETTYLMSLLNGSVSGLKAHNQNEQADKLMILFLDKSDKGGTAQFTKNLRVARALNEKNASDPKFTPYQVENALEVTLKDNGINVPVSFLLTLSKDFKPSAPPSNGQAAARK